MNAQDQAHQLLSCQNLLNSFQLGYQRIGQTLAIRIRASICWLHGTLVHPDFLP